MIALLIVTGLLTGYLLAGAVTGKIQRHNAANTFRVQELQRPERTLLTRRLKK
jgi:hypothetical protein